MNPTKQLVIVSALALAVAACEAPQASAPPPAPRVEVSPPVERDVVEWDEYTARLEAVDFVEVRARVSGHLDSVHFEEGALVAAKDLLFVIDPRPYEATLRRAEAELALSKARLALARKRFERVANLVHRKAMSQEEADTRAAEARQAEASVAAVAAAVEAARLDVEFTHVKAPVAGRVSRKLITEGNLVNGGSGTQGTLLTTIVSLDPIYAVFEADERSHLKYARLGQNGDRPVRVGLADEEGFPREGSMDFVDNRLDPATGTMIGRAVLPNHDLLLSPGLFVRLRVPGSARYRALLLPDEAIGTDQAEKFVWVVNGESRAEYRAVRTGPLDEGLRIVREGLAPGDRVIVAGTQRVRPGIEVAASGRTTDTKLPQPESAGAGPDMRRAERRGPGVSEERSGREPASTGRAPGVKG